MFDNQKVSQYLLVPKFVAPGWSRCTILAISTSRFRLKQLLTWPQLSPERQRERQLSELSEHYQSSEWAWVRILRYWLRARWGLFQLKRTLKAADWIPTSSLCFPLSGVDSRSISCTALHSASLLFPHSMCFLFPLTYFYTHTHTEKRDRGTYALCYGSCLSINNTEQW